MEKSAFLALSGAATGLQDDLKDFLLDNAFDNKYTVHPRKLADIGGTECAAFLAFLEAGDGRGAGERGRKFAMEGMGVKIALGIASRIRVFSARTLWSVKSDGCLAALEAIDSYTSAFLAGFMEGYEANLLLEQERTYKALAAAQAAASGHEGRAEKS
jgi:hypothetical protein